MDWQQSALLAGMICQLFLTTIIARIVCSHLRSSDSTVSWWKSDLPKSLSHQPWTARHLAEPSNWRPPVSISPLQGLSWESCWSWSLKWPSPILSLCRRYPGWESLSDLWGLSRKEWKSQKVCFLSKNPLCRGGNSWTELAWRWSAWHIHRINLWLAFLQWRSEFGHFMSRSLWHSRSDCFWFHQIGYRFWTTHFYATAQFFWSSGVAKYRTSRWVSQCHKFFHRFWRCRADSSLHGCL